MRLHRSTVQSALPVSTLPAMGLEAQKSDRHSQLLEPRRKRREQMDNLLYWVCVMILVACIIAAAFIIYARKHP